jgi:hypothetical protein
VRSTWSPNLSHSSFRHELLSISSSFPTFFHTHILNHGCSATSVLASIPSDQSSTDLAVIPGTPFFYSIQICHCQRLRPSDRVKSRSPSSILIGGSTATKTNLPLTDSLSLFEPFSSNEPHSGVQGCKPNDAQRGGEV